jgi:hypothetical protein
MSNHYVPQPKKVNSQSSVYFDGSDSSTDAALIQELSGDFNVRIYLERKRDGSFIEVSQFPSFSLDGKWHTDEINTRVVADTRRIRIDNVSENNGVVEVMGDEI